MNREWKIVFIVLLIATITIQGYSIYTYATSEKTNQDYWRNNWSEDTCYIAFPLNYTPQEYYNLTEPDQYILEAIKYPGNWTEPFYCDDSTFYGSMMWADFNVTTPIGNVSFVPLLYNGTYYGYMVGFPGMHIKVELLTKPPEEYWNLTNPDKYLLKAIANTGKWVTVGIDDYHFPPEFNFECETFKYKDKYYFFDIVFIDSGFERWTPMWEEPIPTAIGLSLMWVAAGSVYLVKNRKTKAEP